MCGLYCRLKDLEPSLLAFCLTCKFNSLQSPPKKKKKKRKWIKRTEKSFYSEFHYNLRLDKNSKIVLKYKDV